MIYKYQVKTTDAAGNSTSRTFDKLTGNSVDNDETIKSFSEKFAALLNQTAKQTILTTYEQRTVTVNG